MVITDIYHRGTGEQPIPGVTGEGLAKEIERRGNPETMFIMNINDIANELTGLVKPGDIVVTMGAGNIDQVAGDFVQRMRSKWKDQL